MTDDLQALLEDIREFGWRPSKRLRNLTDHKIDFVDVQKILNGYTFIRRSDRYGEIRYQIFGYLRDKEVSVACTIEGSKCHIISVRPARKDERRKYYICL
jgi:uncharacterized DUF497 family protein